MTQLFERVLTDCLYCALRLQGAVGLSTPGLKFRKVHTASKSADGMEVDAPEGDLH
jgi:hypothetical protein